MTSAAERGRAGTRLVAVSTTILVIAALKLSAAVTLPLAIAVFLIVLAWPLQAWLERRLPRWAAVVTTVVAVLAVVALIGGAFAYSAKRVAERAPQLGQRVEQVVADANAWARAHNVPVPRGATDARALQERLAGLLQTLLTSLYHFAALLGLVVALLVLGLLEVRDFEAKVEQRLRRRLGDTLLDTVELIADKVRRHLLALTVSSAVSGVATGLFAWAMGLELAFAWGFVAFLLNYIPTIGPAVAIIPPTVFALLQFEGVGRPAAVFVGVGAIQFFIGNFVDPKIEGRVLSLSPVVVLFAIVFWGWVWGVFGAFLAVPLTAAIVIVCEAFDSTRWIAALLSDIEERGDAKQ